MNFIKFLFAILSISVLFASCSKENMTEIQDDIPEVVTTDTIIYENFLALGLVSFEELTAQISVQENDTGIVESYIMLVQSPDFSLDNGLFLLQWYPLTQEVNLENKTYTGLIVGTFSNEFLDTLVEWQQNGSNPDTVPSPTDDDIVTYFASDLSIEVTNATEVSANLELSGSMTDLTGNVVEVSAEIFAELF